MSPRTEKLELWIHRVGTAALVGLACSLVVMGVALYGL